MENSSIFKFKFGPFGRFSRWLWTFAQSEHQLFDCEIIKSISADEERWENEKHNHEFVLQSETECCLEASVEERPLLLDVVKRVLLIKTQLLLKTCPFCPIFLQLRRLPQNKNQIEDSPFYTHPAFSANAQVNGLRLKCVTVTLKTFWECVGKSFWRGDGSNKYVNKWHIDVTGAALAQAEKPGYAYHSETWVAPCDCVKVCVCV